jgi:PAS domain S-box-containing protein
MITEAEPIDAPGPRIVYVNNAFEKITGFSRAETIGQSPRILQGPLTDRQECHRIRDGLLRWETTTTTLINYRKDGRTFWNEMTIAPVADSTGWFTHWVSIERDVTQRKETEKQLRDLTGNLERLVKERTGALVESEERFRQMADAINECFCMMDIATKRFLYVSPAYARIWRRSCQSLYEYPQDWFDCVHPDDRKRVTESFSNGPGAQNELDYRIILGGGSVRWIHSRVFFVLNPQGEPYRLVCVASDITESKQMRDQMLRAQRLESLGTLSGGVAHDLNNALSPILMGLDLLRHKFPADADIIDTMEASGKRGASMVGQLLTFAKGVDGERALIHPERLIREIGKLVHGTFPKNISLKTLLPEKEECILGDATQLHQVLLNLCVNARDAMPSGGTLKLEMINVVLTVETASAILNAIPGRYVEWRVSDTGTGISPEVLERIFEPFFTTKAIDKGTGLGLSTVLGIIRSHNGCITVQSTPGEGSTFSVYLPVATDSAIESASAPSTSTAGFRANGELVLVVDDERSIREMTRAVLHTIGFNVLTARDGTEAIIHVAESRADLRLVITDLHMPHMDGLGFARLLRRMTPTTKLIAASGCMDDASIAEFTSIGVDAILQKPFTQESLIGAIKKALELS